MSNDEICKQNHCIYFSPYYDEEIDEYYDCCGATYDVLLEFLPKDCPCIKDFKEHRKWVENYKIKSMSVIKE